MKVRRHSAALVAVAATALAVAPSSAGAATGAIAGGGSFARTVPFIDGTIVAFECHVAAPGALSTSVSSCVLGSVFGPVSAPAATSAGPAAETNGAVALDPATYQVCWTGSATYSDGTTKTTSGCSTSSGTAGAGVSS